MRRSSMASRRTLLRGVCFATAACAALAAALPGPAAAVDRGAPTVDVVATGLNSPRGLAMSHGSLLVAEAGTGGDGPCEPGALGKTCFGLTGAITHIVNGVPNRLV